MTIFVNFLKKYQVFGNFFKFKWQFSGGADQVPDLSELVAASGTPGEICLLVR